jgi:hypothetical protein
MVYVVLLFPAFDLFLTPRPTDAFMTAVTACMGTWSTMVSCSPALFLPSRTHSFLLNRPATSATSPATRGSRALRGCRCSLSLCSGLPVPCSVSQLYALSLVKPLTFLLPLRCHRFQHDHRHPCLRGRCYLPTVRLAYFSTRC